ncbi:MAG: 2,3,4,5-tetrahydropyridine-2,6-dicarboxylate N-succinyltransferase, partial [Cycloclasticus sp.]|nr:2,3,4,5-tetrahydropyridine-2,6-dicarboxylate N-succinyltransferase [Cycloclasticus sp.]
MQNLENIINTAFDDRANFDAKTVSSEVRGAVEKSLALLDSGEARVADKKSGDWVVNQWLKKAVLLSFKINDNKPIDGGDTQYYDKVKSK